MGLGIIYAPSPKGSSEVFVGYKTDHELSPNDLKPLGALVFDNPNEFLMIAFTMITAVVQF